MITPKESLYNKWKHMKSQKNVYIDPLWIDFDGFYKANRDRYYRAKAKWKKYKPVTPVNKDAKYRVDSVCFIRKVKELGYTKKNTVFTSLSDRMKYHETSNKIKFSNNSALLGTRDVVNILKKKGIEIDIQDVNARIKKGVNIFKPNRLKKWKWKGCYMSLIDVCKREGVSYSLVANRVYKNKGESVEKAISYAKKYKPKKYKYKGKSYKLKELLELISKEYSIEYSVVRSRFYRFGYDIDKIINLPKNKHNPKPKKVILSKDGEEFKFNSIKDAAVFCKRRPSNLSTLLNHNRGKTINGYTAKYAV